MEDFIFGSLSRMWDRNQHSCCFFQEKIMNRRILFFLFRFVYFLFLSISNLVRWSYLIPWKSCLKEGRYHHRRHLKKLLVTMKTFISFVFLLVFVRMTIDGTRVPNDDNICPDAVTVCDASDTCCISTNGNYSCCPLEDAVCCKDHIHCCPKLYKCDLKIFKCDRQLGGEFFRVPALEMKSATKKINKDEWHWLMFFLQGCI